MSVGVRINENIFLTKWQLWELRKYFNGFFIYLVYAAFMSLLTATTVIDGEIWYFAFPLKTYWTYEGVNM